MPLDAPVKKMRGTCPRTFCSTMEAALLLLLGARLGDQAVDDLEEIAVVAVEALGRGAVLAGYDDGRHAVDTVGAGGLLGTLEFALEGEGVIDVGELLG